MGRKLFRNLKFLTLFLLVLGGGWVLQQWTYEEEFIRINGKAAQVIDGDSFKSGNEEFRLYGIDAPEYQQTCNDQKGSIWPCGKAARGGLDSLLRKEEHSCAIRTRDQFGRLVVLCMGKETGQDLGATLVASGLAVSGQNFEEVIYGAEEREAQKTKRGIWRGKFVRPDIWRSQNPRS